MSADFSMRRAVHAEQVAATEDYVMAVTTEEGRAAVLRARAAAAAYDALRMPSGPGRVDKAGQRCGAVLVEERAAPSSGRSTRWLCLCECGRRVVILLQDLGDDAGCVVCREEARRARRELRTGTGALSGGGSPGRGSRAAVHAEQVAATEEYVGAVTMEEGRAAILRARAAAAAYDGLRMLSGSGRIDREGQRFGGLVVEARAAPAPSGQTRWLCLCGCGRRVVICAQQLLTIDGCVGCRAEARAAAGSGEVPRKAAAKVAAVPQKEVAKAGPAPRKEVALRRELQVEDVGRWVPPVLTPERQREVLWELGLAKRKAGEPWREVRDLCGEEMAGELRAAELERGVA